jgi:hypothetical protein
LPQEYVPILFLFESQIFLQKIWVPKASAAEQVLGEKIGGAKRDRTADLLHAMQALSQLSYSPVSYGRMKPEMGYRRV